MTQTGRVHLTAHCINNNQYSDLSHTYISSLADQFLLAEMFIAVHQYHIVRPRDSHQLELSKWYLLINAVTHTIC